MKYYSALHWAKKAEKSVEECQEIKDSLGNIYTFKGSVENKASLPDNAELGDVYNLLDSGTNYAWTGEEWDSLGFDVDLSSYATKEYVDTTEQEIIENYMEADTALQTQITGLSSVVDEEQEKIIAIEGKIPTSASSSNLLVTNTDMFNATQDVRADFAEADSDLQTQINGQATAIAGKQDKLTAGTGIKIENNVISNTQTSAEWGNIEGDINSQTDLKAALDDKISKTGDEVKDGSLILVGTLGVEADTDNLPPDSWRINTNQPGVYKMGYRFVGGKGIFFSDYNFKYDSNTLDSETIISNTNMGGTFGSNIKLTSSTSGEYSEISLNAEQAKAPNPGTGVMEKIATCNWVENATESQVTSIMDTIYPVGSFYFCTQDTCPLSAIISGSTWEKVGSSLITSVNTSVPIKGNGITIGLTTGSNANGGFFLRQSGDVTRFLQTNSYGLSVGQTSTTAGEMVNNKSVGLTTDASKSGIVGTVTRTALTVNIFKRTA